MLGGFVGEFLKRLPSLRGYEGNLAGGLTGLALFSLLAFLQRGPTTWLLLGFLLLAPLIASDRLTLVVLAIRVCLLPGGKSCLVPVIRRSFAGIPGPLPAG